MYTSHLQCLPSIKFQDESGSFEVDLKCIFFLSLKQSFSLYRGPFKMYSCLEAELHMRQIP